MFDLCTDFSHTGNYTPHFRECDVGILSMLSMIGYQQRNAWRQNFFISNIVLSPASPDGVNLPWWVLLRQRPPPLIVPPN